MEEKITVREFYNRLVSFRQKMGTKLEGDQYRNLFKMLGLSYLNTDHDDPDYGDDVVRQFEAHSQEYVRRMTLMGHEI